jgi:hypothetical protein
MGHMKRTIAAIPAAALGLLAANMLGVASAEAPTGVPTRTVSVQGTANVPVAQGASAAVATAAYRQGMAAAVADGQSKAEFLTSKVGATLGSVQSIAEGGGYIQCTSSEESGYAGYEGEQPDFGSGAISVASGGLSQGVAAPAAAPTVRKPTVKHHKRKNLSAKKAAAASCALTADVSLLYLIT